jgi:hypothetical protein
MITHSPFGEGSSYNHLAGASEAHFHHVSDLDSAYSSRQSIVQAVTEAVSALLLRSPELPEEGGLAINWKMIARKPNRRRRVVAVGRLEHYAHVSVLLREPPSDGDGVATQE